jgi:hypothetical protein
MLLRIIPPKPARVGVLAQLPSTLIGIDVILLSGILHFSRLLHLNHTLNILFSL